MNKKYTITRPMKEMLYRESRVAKALGEPAKYMIVIFLLEKGPLTVNEMVKMLHRSQPTISHHLAQLRNLEIVRYETKPGGSCYWIKYPERVQIIVKALKDFVARTMHGVDYET